MAQPIVSQRLLAHAYGDDGGHRRVSIFLRVSMIADTLASSLGFLPGRGRSLRASNPRSTKLSRTRSTVARPTLSAAAICLSVRSSAALSKIRARVTFRVECFPERSKSCSCSRSASLRLEHLLDQFQTVVQLAARQPELFGRFCLVISISGQRLCDRARFGFCDKDTFEILVGRLRMGRSGRAVGLE